MSEHKINFLLSQRYMTLQDVFDVFNEIDSNISKHQIFKQIVELDKELKLSIYSNCIGLYIDNSSERICGSNIEVELDNLATGCKIGQIKTLADLVTKDYMYEADISVDFHKDYPLGIYINSLTHYYDNSYRPTYTAYFYYNVDGAQEPTHLDINDEFHNLYLYTIQFVRLFDKILDLSSHSSVAKDILTKCITKCNYVGKYEKLKPNENLVKEYLKKSVLNIEEIALIFQYRGVNYDSGDVYESLQEYYEHIHIYEDCTIYEVDTNDFIDVYSDILDLESFIIKPTQIATTTHQADQEPKEVNTTQLCLDTNHEYYSTELNKCIKIWNDIYINNYGNNNRSVTERVKDWLTENDGKEPKDAYLKKITSIVNQDNNPYKQNKKSK